MKKVNYKIKLQVITLYIMLIVSAGINIISNKNIIIGNKTQTIKEMDESTQVSSLNNTINDLNETHEEYQTYIKNCKQQIATALTNEKVTTSNNETLETMASNISKVLQARTSDASATVEDIIEGKTAYVNGELITGTCPIGIGDGNFEIIKKINTSKSFNQGATVDLGDLSKYKLAIVIVSRTMGNSAYSYAVRYSSCTGATVNGTTSLDYGGDGTSTVAVLLSELSDSVSIKFSGVGTNTMYYGIIGII